MEIADIIRAFVRKEIKTQVKLCTVKSVDEDKATCEVVTDEDMEMFDVRLKSVIENADNGIIVIPKVGSFVLVGIIKNIDTMAFVCGYSEVSKYKINCSDNGVIELNGDSYSMVKADELKKELNTLKGTVDAMIQAFNSWIVIPSDGGAALKTTLLASLLGKTTGDFSKINNDKVKHG